MRVRNTQVRLHFRCGLSHPFSRSGVPTFIHISLEYVQRRQVRRAMLLHTRNESFKKKEKERKNRNAHDARNERRRMESPMYTI